MRAAVGAVLLVVVHTPPAHAQGNVRDFERAGPATERQMYFARVRHEANELLAQWQSAWERDHAGDLARLYADDASYLPHASPLVHSRTAIRAYFTQFLATVAGVHVQMLDFGTSGDLAYLTARVAYRSSPANTEIVRTDMLVLRRRNGSVWQIETHFCREEPAAAPAGKGD